jgi:predicted transcriptional regulator
MSEKRKQVLLLLQDGAKEMGYLLESLDTTRQALLPQMKILEEHYLIDHYKDTYELTTIGKLFVDQIAPLINAIETFDVDIDYWGTHNIDFIPPHLLKRLRKLKNCKIVNPSITELYSLHKSFHEQKNTESVYIVTNFLYPEYRTIFNELMESNVTTNYIVSKQLLEKIKTEHHDNFSFFIKTDSLNCTFTIMN